MSRLNGNFLSFLQSLDTSGIDAARSKSSTRQPRKQGRVIDNDTQQIVSDMPRIIGADWYEFNWASNDQLSIVARVKGDGSEVLGMYAVCLKHSERVEIDPLTAVVLRRSDAFCSQCKKS